MAIIGGATLMRVTELTQGAHYLVLVFAWAFELTPEGIKRETEVDRSVSIRKQPGVILLSWHC